ncbi:MAG: maleylpyruvate isomerase family mycothiol-dependent enzyme [Acidimicrobiales bacterium]
MTKQAVAALTTFHTQIEELAPSLAPADWIRPSACPGWRVRDVFAHLGQGASSILNPMELPEERLPLPENRERQHDIHVDIRRDWSVEEVVEEFTTYGRQRLDMLPGFQEEPLASNDLTIEGLGTYPMHAAANGLAFDHYSHLHNDLTGPAGPLDIALPELTHEQMYPVVQFMMWGLPQMQGPELDAMLLVPTTLALTGPGESTWTITRPQPDGGLVVEESDGGEVTVTSTATDFSRWGTGRAPFWDLVEIEGDPTKAIGFLATLDIV